jgi:glycosyltransferase involved in cell wall biosynthesis
MRIANVLISGVWGDVNPDALETGIGGREGAMVYLSKNWAMDGHEVTSFVNCERGKRFKETWWHSIFPGGRSNGHYGPYGEGYHEYIPLNMTKGMLQNFPFDVVIAWECPSIFKDPISSENIKLKVCEMQVAHLNNSELRAANKFLDVMCGLSDWHCEFLVHQGLDLPRENIVTLPNGVQIDRYKTDTYGDWKNKKTKPGKNWKFVYSSSPDRGLWHLLKCWPEIRKLNPGATLQVGYGVKNWTEVVKYSHGRVAEMAVDIEIGMRQEGVKDIGKIGQGKLSKLQISADAWLYPFDPIQPTETGCITAIENAAAGNPIITTDADCMESEFGSVGKIVDLPFSVDSYVGAIEEVMTDNDKYQEMQEKGYELAASRNWADISHKWIKMFEEKTREVI